MRFELTATLAVFALWAADAEAKRVRLHCSEGYSITVTFSLHRSPREMHEELGPIGPFTVSCPPDAVIEIGDDDYDGLHAEWDMEDPDGNQSSGSLPPGFPPPAGQPPPDRWAVWGVHPRAPSSYICNAIQCVEDPLAPSFIQAGEFLLGTYDPGTDLALTVNAVDAVTGSRIAGATVNVLNTADDSVAASGATGSSGSATLTVPAGGKYYVQVKDSSYFQQVSASFYMFTDHTWTMVLTAGSGSGLSQPNVFLSAVVVLIVLILFMGFRRRRTP